MSSLPSVFVELKASTTAFQAAMGKAQSTVEGFSKNATSNVAKFEQVGKVAFTTIGLAAVGFGALAVKAFSDAQKVSAQTAAVLESTGGVAGVSAGQVDVLADSLRNLSGVDDDTIQAGENLLLTFTNVRNEVGQGNDIFNQATKAALDMSVAMGEDMHGSVIRLGKALQDPISGLTALRRVGVAFTDEQKDQIKTLVASGNTMEAQKVILAELQKEFGGSAEAAGKTFAGQLAVLRSRLEDVAEGVGAMIVPALTTMASTVANVVGWLNEHRAVALALAGALAGPLVAAMTVYIAKQAMAFGSSVMDAIQDLAKGLYGLVAGATAAAAAETSLATTTALATGGLSLLGAGVGLLAAKWLSHSSSTDDAGSSAKGATGALSGLTDIEGELADDVDATTNQLKAQAKMFKELSGDTNAQQTEVLKLIGDQNSLDAATEKLAGSTGKNSEATKFAVQHAKDLESANKNLKSANDSVTEAVEKQQKAQEKLNKLLAPQTVDNIAEAQDNWQASQDRTTKANIDLTEKQKAYNVAVAQFGPDSEQATLAHLDLNSAQREVNDATRDGATALQALADAQRATVGTTAEVKDATKELEGAGKDVTTAQGAQKDAQTKLNEVLADDGAVKAAKQDSKDLAANTLAWQKATMDLNADWGTLEKTLAQHPELRGELVTTIKGIKDNLPKGADIKPFTDMIDKLIAYGETLAKVAPPGSMLEAMVQGKPLFGNPPAAPSPIPATPGSYPVVSQFNPFGPGHAAGGLVGPNMFYPVGEKGPELLYTGSASGTIIPNHRIGGGTTITVGDIYVTSATGDPREIAVAVRDELLRMGRNNDGVGLG